MLCTEAIFLKKSSSLVDRIVSFDPAGLHLLTLRILEPYPSKDTLTVMALSSYPFSLV